MPIPKYSPQRCPVGVFFFCFEFGRLTSEKALTCKRNLITITYVDLAILVVA